MATLAAIRAGLAANLGTIADCQVSAYMLAQPTPPTLQVMGLEQIVYDRAAQRGLDTWTLTIQGFAGLSSDIGSQKKLDAWLASSGSASVKAAVESDRTLGGAAQTCRVTGCSGYRVYGTEGRAPVLGCEWTVEVHATG